MTQKPAKPAARAKRAAATTAAEPAKPVAGATRRTAPTAAETSKPTPRPRRATAATAAEPARPGTRVRRATGGRPDDPAETVTAAAPASPDAGGQSPSFDEISQRAYFISLEQGGGDEVANWLQAERELATA